jgi:hypothetical protein
VAIAAIVLGIIQLAFGWRFAVWRVAPDLLVILAAFVVVALPPVNRIPSACAIGLWADFLTGGRLGLMALGYGVGAWTVNAAGPVVGDVHRSRRSSGLGKAVGVTAVTLVGGTVAHLAVAVVSKLLGASSWTFGAGLLRAIGIGLYSSAVAPLVWLALALTLGPVERDAWSTRPNVVES